MRAGSRAAALGTYVAYLVALVRRPARRRAARGRSGERRDRAGGAARRRRRRCSRRSCPGSSSTGRRGSRAGAGRRRSSPTASCAGSGGRAPSRRGDERGLPARAGGRGGQRRRGGAARLRRRGRGARARASATTCSRLAGLLALGPLRARRRVVGRGQRLRAHGREPRPDDRRLRRGHARPLARASPRSSPGRPTSSGIVAATAGSDVWASPALALARGRVRARRGRRDGPAAGRQPGHAPRADDDPRGAAARVRGPRPRVPAVGGRRAALARARAARPGVPAARAGAVGASSRCCRSCSSCSAAALALTETLVAKMRILLVPRLLAVGGVGRAARDRDLAGAARVSGGLVWAARRARARGRRRRARRSVAVGLVTAQALVLVGVAIRDATSGDEVAAAGALALRALGARGALLRRSSRARASRGRARADRRRSCAPGVAVALALALTWLVPTIGLDLAQRRARRARARRLRRRRRRRRAGRRCSRCSGSCCVENGLALAALAAAGRRSSLAIELGVALDLDARRARRGRLPRADLRRVRGGRLGRAEEPA